MELPFHAENISCDVCGKCFQHESQLLYHMKLHAGKGPFICGICDEMCTARKQMRAHMKLHGVENLFSCHICGRTFSSNRNVKSHMMGRDRGNKSSDVNNPSSHVMCSPCVKTVACQVCSKLFYREYQLMNHMNTHHRSKCKPNEDALQKRSTKITFYCKYCNKIFKKEHNLQKHVKNLHQDPTSSNSLANDLQFRCSTCSMVFLKKSELNLHMTNFHAVRHCANCSQQILQTSILAVGDNHEDGRLCKQCKYFNELTCSWCFIQFGVKSEFILHMSSFHRVQQCTNCSQWIPRTSFSAVGKNSDDTLLCKECKHFNEQLTCSQCFIKFCDKAEFILHMGSKHSLKYCTICSAGISPTQILVGSHVDSLLCRQCQCIRASCSLCSQVMRFSVLRTHIRSHLGETIEIQISRPRSLKTFQQIQVEPIQSDSFKQGPKSVNLDIPVGTYLADPPSRLSQ